MPRVRITKQPCGCFQRSAYYHVQCERHYREGNIKQELWRCIQWAQSGPLRANDPADRRVINYINEVAYWAARGAEDNGGTR